MHRVKFSKLFFLAALAACGTQQQPPDDLLPEPKMVEVMTDIHIFEAFTETKKMTYDTLAVFANKGYESVFEKQGVDKQKFLLTFQYYEQHPAEMDELMTKVIDELSRREAEIKGEIKNEDTPE